MEELGLKNYAYLGDAVWELFVREKTVNRSEHAEEVHKITTERVKASAQKEYLIEIENILTEEEQELARRGRNLSVPVGRKSNQGEYRMATAFEVLIGWWYKNNPKRLNEIEEKLKKFI